MNLIKVISVVLAILLVINIFLFSFGKISVYVFWGVIFFSALFAYFGIPYFSER